MPVGVKCLLVIAISIFLFLKDKKVKIFGVSLTLILLIFGKYLWYLTMATNKICIIYSIIMICLGSILLIRQKNIEKNEKGINTTYESSLSLRIICLLIPLVGLIVYAVNIVQSPKIAKECGKWALIGFGIGIVLSVISMCIVMFG